MSLSHSLFLSSFCLFLSFSFMFFCLNLLFDSVFVPLHELPSFQRVWRLEQKHVSHYLITILVVTWHDDGDCRGIRTHTPSHTQSHTHKRAHTHTQSHTHARRRTNNDFCSSEWVQSNLILSHLQLTFNRCGLSQGTLNSTAIFGLIELKFLKVTLASS